MTALGSLYWRIGGDVRPLREATTSSESLVRKLGSRIQGFNNSLSLGPMGAFIGTAAGLAGIRKAISAANEQEQAERKRNAVLKATGNAAGFTAGQMNDMAASMQRVTTISDEVVINAQAVMASFKLVQGDIFKEAIKSAADMSAVMGTSLQGSVVQLGKALNDPIKGVSALAEVGVTFTAQQREQIRTLTESGRIMDAQRIILAELKSEFGGAAEAMAKGSGQMKQFANALGDAWESVGALIVGALTDADERGKSFLQTVTDNITSIKELMDLERKRANARNNGGDGQEGFFSSERGFRQMLGKGMFEQLQRSRADTMRGLNSMSVAAAMEASGASQEAIARARQNQQLLAQMAGKSTEESQALLEQRRLQSEIAQIIAGPKLSAMQEEIQKLDQAAQQEKRRLDTVAKIEARQRELLESLNKGAASSGQVTATKEQMAAVYDQVQALDRLREHYQKIEDAQARAASQKAFEEQTKAAEESVRKLGERLKQVVESREKLREFRMDVRMMGMDEAERRIFDLDRRRSEMEKEARTMVSALVGVSPEQRAAISKELMDGIAVGFQAERDKAIKEMAKSQADTFSFSGAQEAAKSFQVALLGKNSEQIAERQLRAQLTAAEEARKTEKNTGNMANVVSQIAGMIRDSIPKLLTAPMGGVGN